MMFLVTLDVVELSVWMGKYGFCQCMLIRDLRRDIIALVVMNRAPSSDSAAEAMKN